MLSYAHAKAQEVVRSIPDGQYFHAEYADEDSDGGLPCRIAITLTVKDGSVILDYTGSDPQLTSSLNMPTGGREQHALVMVGLGYVLYTLDKTLLMNSGVYRVARAILPRGSVVHAVAPAAVGMRSLTCIVTQLGTFGVFAKAIPERLGASPAGGNALMFVRTLDTEGRTIMASVGPLGGGAGGGPSADGTDGAGASSAYLKNTPIEISESEIPIRFKEYGLAPGLRRRRPLAGRCRSRHGVRGLCPAHHHHRAQPRPLHVRLLGPQRRLCRGLVALHRQSSIV